MGDINKHIGIVACSAEGAALCYKTICTQSPKLLGEHAHPEISMHSHSLADYVDCLNRNDMSGIAELMLSSAHKLSKMGVDFLICPDNTIHQAFGLVVKQSPLPWLHIAEVVIKNAQSRQFKKLGLLGTKWLVESEVYPTIIEQYDLQWQIPNSNEINQISRIIMDELVNGIVIPESVLCFQQVIQSFKDQGCDAVILGCTEIPFIINDENSVLPTLNSNRLLAEQAIEMATSGYKSD